MSAVVQQEHEVFWSDQGALDSEQACFPIYMAWMYVPLQPGVANACPSAVLNLGLQGVVHTQELYLPPVSGGNHPHRMTIASL